MAEEDIWPLFVLSPCTCCVEGFKLSIAALCSLDPCALVNCNYTSWKLGPGQFTLLDPYQRPSKRRKLGNSNQPGKGCSQDPCAASSTAVPPSCSTQELIPAPLPAVDTACRLLCGLLAGTPAHQRVGAAGNGTTAEHINPSSSLLQGGEADTGAPDGRSPPLTSCTAASSEPVFIGQAAAAGGTDDPVSWIALAALRYVLKPKILLPIAHQQKVLSGTLRPRLFQHEQQQQQEAMGQTADAGDQQQGGHEHKGSEQQQFQPGQLAQPQTLQQSLPLFNTLVSNPLPVEVVALAHEAEVLLPPHSTFCMSEAHQMQKVVEGEEKTAEQV